MALGQFNKRYFKTLNDFFVESQKIKALQKKIKDIPPKDKISPDFAEKIMLAVTGVNSCVYCSYLHAKTALKKALKMKK